MCDMKSANCMPDIRTLVSVLNAGAVPGEEPASHLHPQAERIPRSSCDRKGKTNRNETLVSVVIHEKVDLPPHR